MQDVRAAVVGLGWWGGELAMAAGRSGCLEVTRCFARTPGTREAFAAEHGCAPASSLEEILADPGVDALLVATPHSHHREVVEAAASAGKHVFVDKPFTLTVEDAAVAIAAAERAGVVLQVGHNRRRRPAARRMRAMIDDGTIGMVHQLESTHTTSRWLDPPRTWRSDPQESPLGGMTGLGVHTLDTYHYLAGPVARVTARSTRLLGRSPLDDVTMLLLEFASGALGYLGTSLVVPRRAELGVYGTGAAAWSVEDGTRLYVQGVDDAVWHEEPVEPFDDLADQLAEFARCVRDGGRPETGGAEGLAVVQVLVAAQESVRSGRAVDVDDYR